MSSGRETPLVRASAWHGDEGPELCSILLLVQGIYVPLHTDRLQMLIPGCNALQARRTTSLKQDLPVLAKQSLTELEIPGGQGRRVLPPGSNPGLRGLETCAKLDEMRVGQGLPRQVARAKPTEMPTMTGGGGGAMVRVSPC